MVSRKLWEAVKLSRLRQYEIAQRAGMNPSTLSRMLIGIDDAKPGDPRILRVAKIVGIKPKEAFKDEGERTGTHPGNSEAGFCGP